MNGEERHTLSLLVSNKAGVLIRVALVFSRRGFNLASLTVSPTHHPEFSRMTIVSSGDRETLRQIALQLEKLVDVVHVADHTGEETVEGELAYIKVSCPADRRTEIFQVADHFRARSVDLTEDTATFEVVGTSSKLDAFQLMLEKHGILESVRSGKLVIARGRKDT